MSDGTTHYAGCIQAGPKHYECALLEIGRLRDTVTDLRVKLEAAKQEAEIQKAKPVVVNTFINPEVSIVSSYKKFPL